MAFSHLPLVASLLARFDGAVMRVEPAQPLAPIAEPVAAQRATRDRLQAWCMAGAGDGRSPFWTPGALPRVEQRFAVATLDAGWAPVVEAFSRHLDGSDQLAACGKAAGVLLRLRVKRDDALWWRERQPTDPWDCGYLRHAPQAWQRFAPRRATLLVAEASLPEAAVGDAVQLLQARSATFHHPVRLLVLANHGAAPVSFPVTRAPA